MVYDINPSQRLICSISVHEGLFKLMQWNQEMHKYTMFYHILPITNNYGQVEGTYECSNELSCSIKYGEFLNYLRTG